MTTTEAPSHERSDDTNPVIVPTHSPALGAPIRAVVAFAARLPHPGRWALAAVLAVNAAMGLVDLPRMGLQNTYYAAAAWSASRSWHAFFFAGLDPAGGATVDKPPLAFWVEGLSVRIFGLNSWALLVPQVVMGVGCSALLYLTVRRLGGPAAGLLAALLLTFTPVAVWMFKSDNPDPLMALLLVAAAYCLVRALDDSGIWWAAASGCAVGLAFEAKMLEAAIALPGLGLALLICGAGPLRKRLSGLLAAAAAMVATGLWWMVVVTLTPESQRPYIASTDSNSVFDLAFGYNGAARLGAGSASLRTSDRLFTGGIGLLISFLLPAALLALPVLLLGPRWGRLSKSRAAGVLFGGWLLAGAVTLTYSTGLINIYYVLVIAPAIAGLVSVAGVGLWRHRHRPAAVVPLTAVICVTGIWGAHEWAGNRHADWAWLSALTGVAALVGLSVTLARNTGSGITRTFVSRIAAAAMVLAVCLPTAAAAVGQVHTVHEQPMLYSTERPLLAVLDRDNSGATFLAAVTGGRAAAELELQTRHAVLDIGGYHGGDSLPTLPTLELLVQQHRIRFFVRGLARPAGAGPSATRAAGDRGADRADASSRIHPVALVTALSPGAQRPKPSARHGAPPLAALFTAWVADHYQLVYTDGQNDLYDLFLPIRRQAPRPRADVPSGRRA